jgi:hypothetical protein
MKSEFAWLIETDGPHYIYLDRVGQADLIRWTRDANKAIRFARRIDADAMIDGLRRIEPDLFKFPTHQTAKAVEHGWDVHETGDHLVREQTL